MNDDIKHLNLLAIFHYVLSGLMALMGFFPLIYVAIGIAMLSGALPPPENGPEDEVAMQMMGGMFTTIGVCAAIFTWTLAFCLFLAGRGLARRTRYIFCFVVACLMCLQMPLGTALGIFTILVLSRDSVRVLFGRQPQSPGVCPFAQRAYMPPQQPPYPPQQPPAEPFSGGPQA